MTALHEPLARPAMAAPDAGASPLPSSGNLVAVVGAGVAGMACASRLALFGHDVALFEARPRERLPDADGPDPAFERLVALGRIRCEYGHKLGLDLDLADLHLRHDAVFLATGLAAARVLGLTGDDPAGLAGAGRAARGGTTSGMVTVSALDDLLALPAPQRAVVIGASRSAVGMAARIKQLGAHDVTLAQRHALVPDGAQAEVARACFVRVRGRLAPLEVLRGERGAIEAVRFEQIRMLDGRVVHTGGFSEIAAHAVFKAVGRAAGPALDAGVARVSREGDRVRIDGNFRCALPGIYAGGDCVAARLALPEARRHGLLAAQAIHADLQS